MISFRVDSRSGVPPYLQIVQQVRQALRMGVLDAGDQLPTVREVVAAVAVNPNTVLKAYRDLEREGLVEARVGQGTFVLRRPAGPPPTTHSRLGRSLARWVREAREAGLDDEAMESLLRITMRAVDATNAAAEEASHEHIGRTPRGGPRRPFGAPGASPAIETRGLTKRYPRVTALSDCSITVPAGRISALVGPNGAGKTTLLRMLAGLARPTGGTAAVLGGAPRQDPAFLAEIGYLAQEIPLYRRLSAEDHIRAGAHLNPRWDDAAARDRLHDLRVPLAQPVGTLSGGQRAQVALTLALAKQPRVLLLDEPVAALDPLARRQFLATLTAAVADAGGDLTVLLSSHVIADVERVCDHMVLLAASRVQLCGDIDELLAEHKLLVGPRKDTSVLGTHAHGRAGNTRRTGNRRCSSGLAGPFSTLLTGQRREPGRPRAWLHGRRGRARPARTSPRLEKTNDLARLAAVPRAGGDRGRTAGRVRSRADRHRGGDGFPVALRARHLHGGSFMRLTGEHPVLGQLRSRTT